ncbi:hypothetical protein B0J15DRAFT_401913 [Fusarium solani]|uniref:DNA-directed RNA polymerase subunit n=1 Tax=Fusarium solani TaxID=169388 RepID=A0A9P9GXI0_FUSSL|nr:uncharacterized protein B0J15DRAFT_401913 [Fusarium solani]KAH7246966.1 hypothetical protein B0J15DRAFT_401913 [Fusarium solani]
MQFCNDCGNLLPLSQNPEVTCDCCDKICKNILLRYTTISTTNDFPSELRNKRTINMPKNLSSQDTWSKTDTKCRECDAQEVQYTALQLRSADEGTTMFYSCPKCGAR